jgi:peptide-methionine (S)-S-oxide reductase
MAATKQATFGGGCFWGMEPPFRELSGVVDAPVGYMGGTTPDPTYPQVCTGKTGHAEVVQVEYDPEVVDYQSLVQTFFAIHDPTTLNRQGNDVGTQYRSVIFYHDEAQEKMAHEVMARISAARRFDRPIVTEISPASTFWRAEEYHQRYYEKRGIRHCAAMRDSHER